MLGNFNNVLSSEKDKCPVVEQDQCLLLNNRNVSICIITVCCFEQGQGPASEQEQCCGLNKGNALFVNMGEIVLLNKPNVWLLKKGLSAVLS